MEATIDQKRSEMEWHDNFYSQLGISEYPKDRDAFLRYFERVHLVPYEEGGWSWWGDIRKEIMAEVGNPTGKRVLDYGCGSGSLGMYLALLGANVIGFDLSSEGIKIAQRAAIQYQVSARFDQMDAENLTYPDESFDLIIGFGVLHHVIKYSGASEHLRRILAPGGMAIFAETLWDNPAINICRRFTVTDDDAGDAKLTEASIQRFALGFPKVELRKRHLLYLLKRLSGLPIRDVSRPLKPRPLWQFIHRFDELILRIPGLRSMCGEVIVILRK